MTQQNTGCRGYRSLNRRQALRAGVLGTLGLSLPDLLRASTSEGSSRPAAAKSVIMLWLQGGVSHLETFDPKPDAPAEVRGEFGVIPTKLPGVQFCDKIPLLAGMLDQYALIRSVTHGESAHERGSMYMVEGRRPGKTGASASGNPHIGCIVSHVLGAQNHMPAFVNHPGNDFTSKFTGNGWLPFTASGFRGHEVAMLKPPPASTGVSIDNRLGLLQQLEGTATHNLMPSWDRFMVQAAEILTSEKASQAFDISKEPESVRKLYGVGLKTTEKMPELTLAARRLVEAGTRFVTVGRDSWDHHANIFPQLKSRLPIFDVVFTGLLTDLKQRGLLDETLVVYLTEYGRTPKVNDKAGRDHWPQAFSVAFAGAGIRPGQVIGATDDKAASVKNSPVSPEEIAATILHLLGIDPHKMVTRVDGRPVPIIEKAQPIRALLA